MDTAAVAYDKGTEVKCFFEDIAPHYDLTNSLISLGCHHYWRRFAVARAGLSGNEQVLDLCCGTGRITREIARMIGPTGQVTGLDFSPGMLMQARKYLTDEIQSQKVTLTQGDALALPFASNSFDTVITGYGLRNVANLHQALQEIYRVLKHGGTFVSLELAKPYLPGFRELHRIYTYYWIPCLGKWLTKNKAAYDYLGHSITAYPHQHTVTEILRQIRFREVNCYELTWGTAAVHTGVK